MKYPAKYVISLGVVLFLLWLGLSGHRTLLLLSLGIASTLLTEVLCVFIGSQPQYLYALLPWEVDYWPFDTTHVLAQMQLLFFSALAFVWLNKQGLYPPELHSINIDAEWLYRTLLPTSGRAIAGSIQVTGRDLTNAAIRSFKQGGKSISDTRLGRFHLAINWPTGSMVLWITIVLGFFLLADAFLKPDT